jgi:GTP cyclohydrolase FolE2
MPKKPKIVHAHMGIGAKKAPKLPDTQNTKAPHAIPLQKVGIHEFLHPAFVGEGDWLGVVKEMIAQPADFSMYVDLDAKNKGISMSRLPRLLSYLTYEKHPTLPAGPLPIGAVATAEEHSQWHSGSLMNVMRAWTKQILVDIPGSRDSYIKARVKVPKWKRSPASMLRGIEYYETVFEARNLPEGMRYYITLKVRYISTCPCSLHLSQHAEKNKMVKRANPHMQPSYATIKVEVNEFTFLDADFVHRMVVEAEKALVTIPYPMVKREDEQAIAIACGKHQMFCEDAARLLAKAIDTFHPGVKDWVIVCDHDESIHSHFATACVWKGLPNGLR